MSLKHIPELLEILGFLYDPQPQVRRIALASLLPYTAAEKSERSLFSRDTHLEQVATLCADQELIAHDALSTLINLTNSGVISARLAAIPGFVDGLVRMIIDEKALLADLACMLLSNMTKVESVSVILLNMRLFSKPQSEEDVKAGVEQENDVEALDLLLEVFLKGDSKKYNPNANYDFLASVFANVSTIPVGRAYLLSTPSPELEPPLAKLISFTEHPSTIRRGGVASSIKNSAFERAAHARLVAAENEAEPITGAIDLLPQMLLPLCGAEEFDIDVLDTLPLELQLLPPTKAIEPDPAIRLILAETLVLLATTRACREAMRIRGVYEVIKAAHLVETVDKVTEPMVRLVNLLMRDEGPETAEDDGEGVDEPTKLSSDTILVASDGKEVKPFIEHVPAPSRVFVEIDSEDEDEMLIEV